MKAHRPAVLHPLSFILHPSSFLCALLLASAAIAQSSPPPSPSITPPHDISGVDTAPTEGAIATPLPQKQQRKLRRYDLPELAGSRQAVGSQLIDGRLPRPLVDYTELSGGLKQRISIFEGGLVVVTLSAPDVASIRKRLLIPPDALAKYVEAMSVKAVSGVRQELLRQPAPERRATIRVYDGGPPNFVERAFDPVVALPKALTDAVLPLQDLMRAVVENRTVTNSVANYIPKAGDELVGDDRNVYRVVRVVEDQGIVELKCLTNPTTIFVRQTDLASYFIGKPGVKQ